MKITRFCEKTSCNNYRTIIWPRPTLAFSNSILDVRVRFSIGLTTQLNSFDKNLVFNKLHKNEINSINWTKGPGTQKRQAHSNEK